MGMSVEEEKNVQAESSCKNGNDPTRNRDGKKDEAEGLKPAQGNLLDLSEDEGYYIATLHVS